jgi:hypothetical protein
MHARTVKPRRSDGPARTPVRGTYEDVTLRTRDQVHPDVQPLSCGSSAARVAALFAGAFGAASFVAGDSPYRRPRRLLWSRLLRCRVLRRRLLGGGLLRSRRGRRHVLKRSSPNGGSAPVPESPGRPLNSSFRLLVFLGPAPSCTTDDRRRRVMVSSGRATRCPAAAHQGDPRGRSAARHPSSGRRPATV